MFVWNILLALGWAAISGDFTLVNVSIGFVLGYGILYLAQRITGRSRYSTKVPQLIGFIVYYIWLFILANLRIAYNIITPGFRIRPGVIAIPLEARSDLEIVTLANLLNLTPGTLSLDVPPIGGSFIFTLFTSTTTSRRFAERLKRVWNGGCLKLCGKATRKELYGLPIAAWHGPVERVGHITPT